MTERRIWVCIVLALTLITGPFLRDLAAKSVDRFAIWDSTLTNPAVVTNTTPGGSDYALVSRIVGTPAVSISGTPSVTVSGTAAATQSGTWTVQPGNTPNTTPWLVGGADTVGSTVALNALNAAASVAMAGQRSAIFFLAAGTLTGTLTPEVSFDGGTTWAAVQFVSIPSGAVALTSAHTNPNAATKLGVLSPFGATHVRVRVSAFTTGTANGTVRAIAAPVTGLFGTDGTNMRAPVVTNTTPGGSDYGLAVRAIGTFGGTSAADASAVTAGVTPGTLIMGRYLTSNPSLSNGNAYLARIGQFGDMRVEVPARGATPFSLISAASTNATSVSSTATVTYGCSAFNFNASVRYLKIYNVSGTPTSSDTPVLRIPIPGTSGGVGGVVHGVWIDGVQLSTGFGVRLTTNLADSDNTAVGANEIVLNCPYTAAA